MEALNSHPILDIEHLTKIYGKELRIGKYKIGRRIVAANDVSFSVNRGEIFGFLGPNGAGKTTVIRSILGYLTLKSGKIKIYGMSHRNDGLKVREKMGHIPGDVTLYGNFTGEELLRYFENYRPVDSEFLKKLRKIFKVDLTLKIRNLSSGNRQQVAIITALSSNPDLLILDEPSSGLDPLMASRFQKLLREMAKQGKTIFLSSHDLAEVQAICDRVGIIREGQIIVVESVKELRRKSIQNLIVEFSEDETPSIEEFKGVLNVISVDKRDGIFSIKVKEDVNELLKVVTSHRIKRMTLEDTSLEEIFLEYYKDELDRLKDE